MKREPPFSVPTRLTIPSFAKMNWCLRVLGRRDDGYHQVESILQTISLHDDLAFELRDDGVLRLTCSDPELQVDSSNLVIRAAQALRDRFSAEGGADIHLEKRIPVQGGLGGGSSNAAMALLGLAHLWNLRVELDDLLKLAATIGADVPFFLAGGTALATGTGTDIRALPDAPSSPLVVIKPGAGVATAEAYKALNLPALTKVGGDTILSSSRLSGQFPISLPNGSFNDFERAIFPLRPEILRARNALVDSGARGALLAGSGACVFGFFDNTEAQERAVAALSGEANWHVFACATLTRKEYLDALGSCARPLGPPSSDGIHIGA